MSSSIVGGRCLRAFGALAVVTTFMSGPLAAVASAEPAANVVAQQESASTVEQKAAALKLIGEQLTPRTARMNDMNLTIYVWDKSRTPVYQHVHAAAKEAFIAELEGQSACHNFIVRDVLAAYRKDVEQQKSWSEGDWQRVRAAEVIAWVDVTRANLDSSLTDYVTNIWKRSKPDTQVRAKAEAVLTPESTDEQRLAYIVKGIFDARDEDRRQQPS